VSITIWHNLYLSYNCHNYSIRRSDSQNKICTSWVSNDYVWQHANNIYCRHNIHWLLQSLKRWCQKKNCSYKTWNSTSLAMEVEESWITSCVAVCSSSMCSSPWAQHNRCICIKFMSWSHMHRERPQVVRWDKLNLVTNSYAFRKTMSHRIGEAQFDA
jgi:hypothetical protein